MPKTVQWTEALVCQFWDALAETRLLRALSFGKLAGPYLLAATRPYLDPQQRILDFGSGDGHFVAHLLAAGYSAAAFEPSQGRQATIIANVGDSPGFLGCIGPDYDGPPFDVLCMFEVVEHILDDAMASTFALIDKFVAPDGLLIVSTPNQEDLELGSTVDPRGEVLFHRWQHVRSLSTGSLSELLRDQGFAPIVMHQIEFSDMVFGSRGAALATRPEFANIFNTYRPLQIGNGERILAIAARPERAAALTQSWQSSDDWSREPVLLSTHVELKPTGAARALPARETAPSSDDSKWHTLVPDDMQQDSGHCWHIIFGELIASSDSPDDGKASNLELYEDCLPLGPRHSLHADIRDLGRGRFSHWGETLYFSASDNTDPRTNGRLYRVRL